jgi:hypothetical protein
MNDAIIEHCELADLAWPGYLAAIHEDTNPIGQPHDRMNRFNMLGWAVF